MSLSLGTKAGAVFATLGTVLGLGAMAFHARAQSTPEPVDDRRRRKPDPKPDPKPKPKPGETAQHAAARELYDHVVSAIREDDRAELGTRSKPSAFVAARQRVMGGLKVDGIYGPKTRARGASLLGHPFPPRPAKSEVVDKIPEHAIDVSPTPVSHRLPAPPPAPPPAVEGVATLIPGAKYRATLKLDGIEKLASNEQVIARIQETVGPWKNPDAQGSGADRIAQGVYAGKQRTVDLPEQVVKLERLDPSGFKKTEPKPAPSKPSKPAEPAADQMQAAQTLYDYVVTAIREGKRDDLGTRSKPITYVAQHQRRMGGLKVDGIYGPKTQDRGAKLLGHPWPARPPKVTIGPAVIKKPAAPPPAPPPAASKPAASKPAASKPAAAQKPARTGRTPTKAANEFYSYVTQMVRTGRGDELGTLQKPNATVSAAQRDMGGLDVDGAYGPKTRARGKELTGREFPSRDYTPPRRTAVEAAQQLYDHAVTGAREHDVAAFGTRTAPNAFVRDAQRDMGGLEVDGIYGDHTRSRGFQLIHEEFPKRPG